MKGPVPNGTLIAVFSFLAIWSAIDAFSMKVLQRMLNSPVYCGDAKCSVTLLPLTVGSAAWGGTPRMLAFGFFIIILKVAATSAGAKAEPSLNFTFSRIVTCRSLPPFWNAYAVASHGCVPAGGAVCWSNALSGCLTLVPGAAGGAGALWSFGFVWFQDDTPSVWAAGTCVPPLSAR